MGPESESPENRRRHPRARASFIVTYRLRSPIRVDLKTASQDYTAVATDISAGGIGIILNEALPVGEKIRVSFTLVNEQPGPDREMRRWFEIHGRPLYCTLVPKAGHRAGIQFLEIPDEDAEFIRGYVEHRMLRKQNL